MRLYYINMDNGAIYKVKSDLEPAELIEKVSRANSMAMFKLGETTMNRCNRIMLQTNRIVSVIYD